MDTHREMNHVHITIVTHVNQWIYTLTHMQYISGKPVYYFYDNDTGLEITEAVALIWGYCGSHTLLCIVTLY